MKYLIVGQGIAGTAVAFELMKLGVDIQVMDPGNKPSASKMSTGLFNPITGRVRKMTWRALDLFPSLQDWYREIEDKLGGKYMYFKSLYYPFINTLEQNDWAIKSNDEPYKSFIKEIVNEPQLNPYWKGEKGAMYMKGTGWVDVKPLMLDFRQMLKEKNRLIEASFDESEWSFSNGKWSNQNLSFDRIIHCGGAYDKKCSFWSYLPIRPLKGEVLQVRFKEDTSFLSELIFNRGVMINSVGDDSQVALVGTNIRRNDETWDSVPESIDEIGAKLKKVYSGEYTVEKQWAGLRPTTADRRPIMGEHPELKGLFIFNGLGTKGISLAPYFARHFVSMLEEDQELDDEVNIKRFLSLY